MQHRSSLSSSSLLAVSLCVAAALWFVMFSPWTDTGLNFWLLMSVSAALLCAMAFAGRRVWADELRLSWRELAVGLLIAAALWGVFWLGDKVSAALFDFARPQVDAIYGLKSGQSGWCVGLLLLFLIGPAEELFWRGYVQHGLVARLGANGGFIAALLLYTLVHVWSLNIMLLLSALVCGGAWGLLYRLFPRRLGALVISHAVWDCAVFVLFPI